MGNCMDTIDWCNLKDMGFVGPNFTWLYQTTDGVQIQEWLDRALAMIGWFELFPATKLFHLTSLTSDQSPLSSHMERRARK